jgi:hypothetical protein
MKTVGFKQMFPSADLWAILAPASQGINGWLWQFVEHALARLLTKIKDRRLLGEGVVPAG